MLRLRLRLVTSQGSPYPSRSPRAHPSGWTRTQGLSHRDSHAPPSFGTTPVRMWNWPLAPLLRRAGNQVVREMPSHTRPSNPEAGSESSDPPRRPLTITRRNGTNGFNGCHGENGSPQGLHGRPVNSAGVSMLQPPTRPVFGASVLQTASSLCRAKAQLRTQVTQSFCKFRVVLQLLVTPAPRRASCGARTAQIPSRAELAGSRSARREGHSRAARLLAHSGQPWCSSASASRRRRRDAGGDTTRTMNVSSYY